MGKSLVERLRSGESIEIKLSTDRNGYSVEVDKRTVWVHGCDCSSTADVGEVKQIHEALGAWLRIQRSTMS